MDRDKKIAIKICGMRDAANILQVASLGPQYFGFIFYPHSPRYVGDNFQMPDGLPTWIKKVGVFVNESSDVIISKAKSLGFGFVQLHGNESESQCEELKETGLGIIKVFSIENDFNFRKTQSYKKVVDYFLFDTKGKHYGGNAEVFDWNLLDHYDQEIPFFLSGGLSSENIDEVNRLANKNIHALDLNSGVELSPGLKSLEKVKAAMEKSLEL